MKMVRFAASILAVALSSCAMTSDVMDTGGGTYMISAHASAVRGGATGANRVAYQDANKFCADKEPGSHAIIVDASERDTRVSAVSGSWDPNGGSFGGVSVLGGNANLYFRCGK